MSNLLGTGFIYTAQYFDPAGRLRWAEDVSNTIPQEGVDYFGNLLEGSASVVTPWYMGVFEGDYTPGPSSAAADLTTTIIETTTYDAAQRATWAGVYDGVDRVANAASRAEFVFNQDKRVYGAFLVSTPGKLDVSGFLLSIARFSSPRDIESGGTLRVLGGIRLVPSL